MANYNDISDRAIILNRLDYGEKDRIITFLTAENGKLKAIAKSVRSPKSKLAGGIELFAENHLMLLSGKSDLCTLTSSRMQTYFGNITKDMDRTMYAYVCLKNINKLTVDNGGSEYYPDLLHVLKALNNKDLPTDQIKLWFSLKLLKHIGVSPNLKTLSNDKPLPLAENYNFDMDHQCFFVHPEGMYSQDHIKVLRFFNDKNQFSPINSCPDRVFADLNRLADVMMQDHLN